VPDEDTSPETAAEGDDAPPAPAAGKESTGGAKGAKGSAKAPAPSGTKGATKSGRVTKSPAKKSARPSTVGKYKDPVTSGRYTPPVPRSVRRSSRAYGITVLALLIVGLLTIVLNYLGALPGGARGWYLIVGLVLIFVGCIMATRYR
jgi:hypothetical protein